jgi:hypothetical protein
MTSVTSLFELLASRGDFSHERREIASPAFGELRRSMGAIIRRLSQSEDLEAAEISNSMRVLLFTWLTSPVAFDSSIRDGLNPFGDADAFETRWGLRGEFKAAIRAAGDMISEKSPLRAELVDAIRTLRGDGQRLKIFCHRKAREHFDSLDLSPTNAPLEDSSFLHSVRDYAATDSFDVLIKVGPLRSKGWGAVPDAIKSAPKYERLIQYVWSGCADDPSFGYDPVEPPCLPGTPAAPHSGEALGNQVAWGKRETKSGHDPGFSQNYDAEQDEFSLFAKPNQQGTRRPTILLEILAGDGILYPRTDVLSFDLNAGDRAAVGLRIPGESLLEGMFVIQTQLGEVAFGETQAQESGYCRIWKQRLREELQSSPDAFCLILRNKGLGLQNLRNCVEYWAQPPHAVIHAPQQRRHFQILIDALAIDQAVTQPTGRDTRPWWQRAWDEIRVTRGEAIQTGRQEHELVEQQALELLKSLLPEIRNKSVGVDGFRLQIPPGHDLCGAFVFFKVLRIEDGFLAPETDIKFVRDLNTLEQWKVT